MNHASPYAEPTTFDPNNPHAVLHFDEWSFHPSEDMARAHMHAIALGGCWDRVDYVGDELVVIREDTIVIARYFLQEGQPS